MTVDEPEEPGHDGRAEHQGDRRGYPDLAPPPSHVLDPSWSHSHGPGLGPGPVGLRNTRLQVRALSRRGAGVTSKGGVMGMKRIFASLSALVAVFLTAGASVKW